jgi:hypothetical protein
MEYIPMHPSQFRTSVARDEGERVGERENVTSCAVNNYRCAGALHSFEFRFSSFDCRAKPFDFLLNEPGLPLYI